MVRITDDNYRELRRFQAARTSAVPDAVATQTAGTDGDEPTSGRRALTAADE